MRLTQQNLVILLRSQDPHKSIVPCTRERQQNSGFVAFRARGVVAALLNMGTVAPPSAVIHRAYHSDTAPVNSPSCEPACEQMRRGYFFAFAGYFAASCAAAMA